MTAITALVVLLLSPALQSEQESGWRIEPMDPPGDETARWPSLAAAGDGVCASWIEDSGDGHRLRIANLEDDRWSEGRTVAKGQSWFVNWADVPRVGVNGSELIATWLDRLGTDTYAYGVRYVWIRKGGERWSVPRFLHTDTSPTEHGFVSLVPLSEGGFAAVWLDGQRMQPGASGHGQGTMTLRTTVIGDDGTTGEEIQLDQRVCECCPTDMVVLDDGTLVIAYRDRSAEEVRDIVVLRGRPGQPTSWTRSRFPVQDGWRIEGCPVNGPALDARGQNVALAWYTAAGERSHVRVAFSDDGAQSFGLPVNLEDVNALGRAKVALMEGGAAVVWMDYDPEDGAHWLLRWVTPDLELEEPVRLGSAAGDRKAGYPALKRFKGGLVAMWTASDGLRSVAIRRR